MQNIVISIPTFIQLVLLIYSRYFCLLLHHLDSLPVIVVAILILSIPYPLLPIQVHCHI